MVTICFVFSFKQLTHQLQRTIKPLAVIDLLCGLLKPILLATLKKSPNK